MSTVISEMQEPVRYDYSTIDGMVPCEDGKYITYASLVNRVSIMEGVDKYAMDELREIRRYVNQLKQENTDLLRSARQLNTTIVENDARHLAVIEKLKNELSELRRPPLGHLTMPVPTATELSKRLKGMS